MGSQCPACTVFRISSITTIRPSNTLRQVKILSGSRNYTTRPRIQLTRTPSYPPRRSLLTEYHWTLMCTFTRQVIPGIVAIFGSNKTTTERERERERGGGRGFCQMILLWILQKKQQYRAISCNGRCSLADK